MVFVIFKVVGGFCLFIFFFCCTLKVQCLLEFHMFEHSISRGHILSTGLETGAS